MSREIRRVPPGWEHPVETCQHFHCSDAVDGMCPQGLLDGLLFEGDLARWREGRDAWDAGTCDGEPREADTVGVSWADYYGDEPDPRDYTSVRDPKLCTAYQVYQTISEGSPVSPVFETREALVDWLVNVGDPYDGRLSRAAAEAFVEDGSAPTMVTVRSEDRVEMYMGAQIFERDVRREE